MKISALISVYKKDNSEYFKNALESLDNQTHKLGEIVLVNDGPLNNKLEFVIKNFIENSKVTVTSYSSSANDINSISVPNEVYQGQSFNVLVSYEATETVDIETTRGYHQL